MPDHVRVSEGKNSHHSTEVHFLLLLLVSEGNVRTLLLRALNFSAFEDITLRKKRKKPQKHSSVVIRCFACKKVSFEV